MVIQALPSTLCTGSVTMQREWNVHKVILTLHTFPSSEFEFSPTLTVVRQCKHLVILDIFVCIDSLDYLLSKEP